MGLVFRPNHRDYWHKKTGITSTPGSVQYMSWKRFRQLRSYACFNNNANRQPRGHPDYDSLFKLKPLLDSVMDTYLNNYEPNRQISVDECMRRFRGRVHFCMYIPSKPTKWGIKVWSINVWCLRDSVTGFCINWKVYTGAKAKDAATGLGQES